jgi:hypothetical protein
LPNNLFFNFCNSGNREIGKSGNREIGKSGKWENGENGENGETGKRENGETGKRGNGENGKNGKNGNWMPRTNTDLLGIPLATEEYGHTLTFLPLGHLPLGYLSAIMKSPSKSVLVRGKKTPRHERFAPHPCTPPLKWEGAAAHRWKGTFETEYKSSFLSKRCGGASCYIVPKRRVRESPCLSVAICENEKSE